MTVRPLWPGLVWVLTALGSAAAEEPWPQAALDAAQQYESGEFETSAEGYRGVIEGGDPRPELTYNLGNALFRTVEENPARLEEALKAYQAAVAAGDPDLRPDALYNSANMLFHMQQLPQAEALYREALRQNPHDAEARYNLELVQRLLQSQPQQQEGGEDQQQSEGDPSENENESEQDQGGEQNQENQEQQGQDQESRENESPPEEHQPPPEPQEEEGDSEDGSQAPQPDPSESPPPEEQQGEPRPARISPEEARRQLEKLEEEEREILRQLLEARREKLNVEKDW